MEKSIVLELQEMATEKRHDIDDLLRKALLVATKLNLHEFREWINHELRGYPADAEIPPYRTTRATIHVFNSEQGRRIPFHLYTLPDETIDVLTRVRARQPISSLVELAKSDESELSVQLSPREEEFLIKGQDEFPMQPVKVISRNAVIEAIDAVRSTILEWSLQLEAEGIVGDGMTFSSGDKERAASSKSIHIQNFQGILGDVSQSQVSQDLRLTVKAGDFDSLGDYLQSNGLSAVDVARLQEAIQADPAPESTDKLGPSVSKWLGQMVTKAASGSWSTAVNVAGTLLERAIFAYYGIG